MSRKKETWKPVRCPMNRDPFPAYYVSDQGRVKSMKTDPPTILVEWYQSKGYACVTLYVGRMPNGDKLYRTHMVSSLVLTAFVRPRPSKAHHAFYMDADQLNNKLDNLAWKTRAEKAVIMHERGTMPIGEDNMNSRLLESEVKEIKKALELGKKGHRKVTLAALGRKYGVAGTTIGEIRDGKIWRHVK